MTSTKSTKRVPLLAAALAVALLSLPHLSMAAASGTGARAFTADDSSAASAVQAKLNKSQFKNVKVDVQNGIATLTGTVDLYEYKVDADKRVHKVKGVNAVRNDIEVAGQDGWTSGGLQSLCVLDQTLEPGNFIIEFWTRLWIAVGQI